MMTWEECSASGMTMAEAARARGKSRAAASNYAKVHGLAFARKSTSPTVSIATRSKLRQIALKKWSDPDYRRCHSENMRQMWAVGVFDGGRFRGEKSREYQRLRIKGLTRAEAIEIMIKDAARES